MGAVGDEAKETRKAKGIDMSKPYNRELIGSQPFKRQVWLFGADKAALLSDVVGFAVGSFSAAENAQAIAELQLSGLVATRRHRSVMGDWDAYCLTSKGFDELALIGYGEMHDNAVRRHLFYAQS